MDFGKLLSDQPPALPTEPRELWASLPNKAKGYGYMRDVQGQVLTAWHERRAERDLVVKVNTGGGKTIDGLIILTSYLNEGHGPALYVAPDKYLVQQVREEAERLGLPTVADPDSPRYLAGQAIAVVNADKLVNGKSVFAATRPTRPPAPIGSVVIDDAHAAIAVTRAQLSLSVDADHPAYPALLDLFADDLEKQAPNELLEVHDRSRTALARVPFWAWREKADRARAILHGHRESEPLLYSWPAVRDVLPLCRAVFTGSALTITPPCPPIRHVTGFAEAKHRVYLTATLADDSVLVAGFAAEPGSVRRPITPLTAGDIGERMILAPQEINPALDPADLRQAVADLAQNRNVVVLVPSDRAAANWRTHTDRIVHVDVVADTVRALRSGPVGLVVLVNKYDGIDLPDDACRVLVLDGLPEVATGDERVEAQVLRHAGTDDRQVQRIEQGMGRGVRSNEDHCVVLLMGSRLAQLVADPRSFARFSPATRAQLDLSREVAQGLGQQASFADILAVAQQALDRDPDWVRLAKLRLASIPAPDGHVGQEAVARRTAFEAATDGDYRRAADLMSAAAAAAGTDRAKGWALEQKAAYLDHADPVGAQHVLLAARTKNSMVLRPLTGVVPYEKLSAVGGQAQRAADFLTDQYTSGAELRLAVQSIADDVAFDPDRTEEAEQALRRMADHLGLAGQRPEKEMGAGPDVLWALGGLSYWVLEAKTGATSTVIHKRDAAQLGHSTDWFRDRYGHDARAVPVMAHRARKMARDATATPGMRVLTEDGALRLREAFLSYGAGLASDRWDTAEAVGSQLVGHKLRATDLAEYLRAPQPAGP